ncbi:MAG TPA: hypothetical protein VN081_00675 [Dongiaceae bacterium]|nr:hypothetical protein [Dongiaceae bacterium]
MSIYRLKSIVRRSTMLGAAFAVAAAAFVPAASTFADALNPLTHRSLTLSSSAPGWDNTDGSGNTTYAQPNSGANGQKTGNTFQFNVSTDSSATGTNAPIKGFSFQYCTFSAGNCMAPGNDTYAGTAGAYTARNGDNIAAKQSDLNVTLATPTEVTSAIGSIIDGTSGDPTVIPNRDNSQGNFVVLTKDVGDSTWTQSTGWTMAVTPKEDGTIALGTATGKNNYITLTNSGSTVQLKTGGAVKVIFFGTDTNYITNPGAGAFFVKINDYNSDSSLDNTTLVDGGVTVANVMNQSIEIQTKVLETMDFSVGTVDPNTLTDAQLSTASSGKYTTHGTCNPILTGLDPGVDVNVLRMGNQAGENSLSTDHTYSTHSYWRLSSNSSAGATVYYSGVTLSNTVGDQIKAIAGGGVNGTMDSPKPGSEQFGLALDNGDGSDISGSTGYLVNYASESKAPFGTNGTLGGLYEDSADGSPAGIDPSVTTDIGSNLSYHAAQLYPLTPTSQYGGGTGNINANYNGTDPVADAINTKFAFDTNSNTIPTPIASESTKVVDCVTGKMRYIANIAATTPAGIYTTKVNYIAAPQY